MSKLVPVLALLVAACATGGDPTVQSAPSTAAVTVDPTPTSKPTSAPEPTTPAPAVTTEATAPSGPGSPPPLTLQPVAEGLSFPTAVAAPPGDERLFVVERRGTIRIVGPEGASDDPFLDLSDLTRTDGERGLLGLAFHPDYASNGRFFVHYSAAEDGDMRLAGYRVSADDPARADPGSGEVLLTVEQPASNHKGGTIAFGPDGYLYLGLGDGGAPGGRFGNGQDPSTLLGTLLRLDVDAGDGYGIPPDNPFVDGGGAPEVWAFGLRNPWRFSFDRAEGRLFIGDVGQNAWEEIDVVGAGEPGLNYGWPITEGDSCYPPSRGACDREGLVAPALVVPSTGDTCSIVGGHVYRGEAIPGLDGYYLYGDLCGGWVRGAWFDGDDVVQERDFTPELGTVPSLVSFGEDAAGELYVVSAEGTVSRIVAAG